MTPNANTITHGFGRAAKRFGWTIQYTDSAIALLYINKENAVHAYAAVAIHNVYAVLRSPVHAMHHGTVHAVQTPRAFTTNVQVQLT